MDEEKFLTIEQALKIYPWSRATLFLFAKQGKLHFHRVPHQKLNYMLRSELNELNKPQALRQPK